MAMDNGDLRLATLLSQSCWLTSNKRLYFNTNRDVEEWGFEYVHANVPLVIIILTMHGVEYIC